MDTPGQYITSQNDQFPLDQKAMNAAVKCMRYEIDILRSKSHDSPCVILILLIGVEFSDPTKDTSHIESW